MTECMKTCFALAEEFRSLQKVFIALGDENRQQLLLTLLESSKTGMRVPEITKLTHLSRPAVSHHLKILKDAGIIEMHRQGTMNFYYISADVTQWRSLRDLTDHVFQAVQEAAEMQYPGLKENE